MKRRFFLVSMGALMGILSTRLPFLSSKKTMPVLFTGHGSPMNVVENNIFTQTFRALGNQIPKPSAILCISAHWLTPTPRVLLSAQPRQIFDFQGFPQELYQITYKPPGAPDIAHEIIKHNESIKGDEAWGLDHGTWSVLHHMFPHQEVPCFQLSLSTNFSLQDHINLARQLTELRTKGVLIIGSGNIVHNLREVSFDEGAPPETWAVNFESFVLETLHQENLSSSSKLEKIFSSPDLKKAHPTVDHLLPLIYAVAAANESSPVRVESSGIQNATISMATLQFLA